MIYVDSMFMPARVGRLNAKWCHLFSDQLDPEELHAFAESIGLRRSWFQPGKRLGTGEPWPSKDHYDVTMTRRAAAVRAGAVEVTRDQAVAIWRDKRDRYTYEQCPTDG